MLKQFASILMVLCCGLAVVSQTRFEMKPFGFSMQEPTDWIPQLRSNLVENIKSLDDSDRIDAILKNHKGDIAVRSFLKYDPSTVAGLIPTVNVNVRRKSTNDFAVFKKELIASTEFVKNNVDNFVFLSNPTEIEISGIRSVYMVLTYSVKREDGQILKPRSRIYAIPIKGYFIQVNLIDGQTENDCTKEFDELVKTIKIGT